MEDWTKKSDGDVFGRASEQPGSQASYWRDIEIRRRLYLLEKANLELQHKVLDAQLLAVDEQRTATGQMAHQSNLMLASVIGIFVTALFTLAAAFIS